MNPLHDFLVALTFLTRLGRARITSSEAISRSKIGRASCRERVCQYV